jgi:hypothetical protein
MLDRIRGTESSKPVLIRMLPGRDDQVAGKIGAADIIYVADHTVRRE